MLGVRARVGMWEEEEGGRAGQLDPLVSTLGLPGPMSCVGTWPALRLDRRKHSCSCVVLAAPLLRAYAILLCNSFRGSLVHSTVVVGCR